MNRETGKIMETVHRFDMLPRGCAVVAGVSGGADSMALLHFLCRFSKENDISLTAAHVNHCLRGEESERDEQFVRDYCRANGIALKVLRANVKAEAERGRTGLEECGRKIRYEFFERLAGPTHAKIATAHTLSDSLETMLLNFTRGTGLHGLCGIPPVRGGIVRPLIALSREEVEQYCAENGITYITDSSNFSRSYARNKIRLDVVPVLREINPALEQAALRASELLAEDDDYLNGAARQALEASRVSGGYGAEKLAALPNPILARAVFLAVHAVCGARLESTHIRLIREIILQGSGAVTMPGGVRAGVFHGVFTVRRAAEEKNGAPGWEFPFHVPKILTDSGREFIIEVISKQEYEERLKFNKLLFNNALDYATISHNTILRNRRAGDIFCRAGRGVTKSVKKLFNEAKLPAGERDCIAILEDRDSGKILWIERFGVSQSAAVKDSTNSVVLIVPEESNNAK